MLPQQIKLLLDYVINTPEDKYTSEESVKNITALVDKNNNAVAQKNGTLQKQSISI
jgi:hypothetical protein